jgi:hypothetical protein
MMMMTVIKGKEQRRKESCGRLHVALNHVTCIFWKSQRNETADVSISGAARTALSSAETRQTLRVLLGVTMATNSRVSKFQVAACRFTMRLLCHKFLPALLFSQLVTEVSKWSALRNGDLKFEVVTVLLLKFHVLRNMTSGRIINNF